MELDNNLANVAKMRIRYLRSTELVANDEVSNTRKLSQRVIDVIQCGKLRSHF